MYKFLKSAKTIIDNDGGEFKWQVQKINNIKKT